MFPSRSGFPPSGSPYSRVPVINAGQLGMALGSSMRTFGTYIKHHDTATVTARCSAWVDPRDAVITSGNVSTGSSFGFDEQFLKGHLMFVFTNSAHAAHKREVSCANPLPIVNHRLMLFSRLYDTASKVDSDWTPVGACGMVDTTVKDKTTFMLNFIAKGEADMLDLWGNPSNGVRLYICLVKLHRGETISDVLCPPPWLFKCPTGPVEERFESTEAQQLATKLSACDREDPLIRQILESGIPLNTIARTCAEVAPFIIRRFIKPTNKIYVEEVPEELISEPLLEHDLGVTNIIGGYFPPQIEVAMALFDQDFYQQVARHLFSLTSTYWRALLGRAGIGRKGSWRKIVAGPSFVRLGELVDDEGASELQYYPVCVFLANAPNPIVFSIDAGTQVVFYKVVRDEHTGTILLLRCDEGEDLPTCEAYQRSYRLLVPRSELVCQSRLHPELTNHPHPFVLDTDPGRFLHSTGVMHHDRYYEWVYGDEKSEAPVKKFDPLAVDINVQTLFDADNWSEELKLALQYQLDGTGNRTIHLVRFILEKMHNYNELAKPFKIDDPRKILRRPDGELREPADMVQTLVEAVKQTLSSVPKALKKKTVEFFLQQRKNKQHVVNEQALQMLSQAVVAAITAFAPQVAKAFVDNPLIADAVQALDRLIPYLNTYLLPFQRHALVYLDFGEWHHVQRDVLDAIKVMYRDTLQDDMTGDAYFQWLPVKEPEFVDLVRRERCLIAHRIGTKINITGGMTKGVCPARLVPSQMSMTGHLEHIKVEVSLKKFVFYSAAFESGRERHQFGGSGFGFLQTDVKPGACGREKKSKEQKTELTEAEQEEEEAERRRQNEAKAEADAHRQILQHQRQRMQLDELAEELMSDALSGQKSDRQAGKDKDNPLEIELEDDDDQSQLLGAGLEEDRPSPVPKGTKKKKKQRKPK